MVKKLPTTISEEDFVKLIKNTKSDKHKIAFLLGFGAGLRVSEVIAVEKRHVDWNNKTIFVEQGKGKKDRIVPLPKGFKQKHLDLLPIGISQRALQIAFKNSFRRAGLHEIKPDAHFHSLRHGFGSNCANKGIPIHQIRTLMGHSNISTTNVYLELNPKEALKSYEELF